MGSLCINQRRVQTQLTNYTPSVTRNVITSYAHSCLLANSPHCYSIATCFIRNWYRARQDFNLTGAIATNPLSYVTALETHFQTKISLRIQVLNLKIFEQTTQFIYIHSIPSGRAVYGLLGLWVRISPGA
jgi:hypothetical protein